MTEGAAPERFRARIGDLRARGFYPAPHRYHLYLEQDCPRSLRVSITLALLGLQDAVGATVLPSCDGGGEAASELRRAYDATWYRYRGPLTVPALCDQWTGRVVSNHTPDILRDLAERLGPHGARASVRLRPEALAARIDAFREFLDEEVTRAPERPERWAAALDSLDRQLSGQPYALGAELTAADVDLWVTLVHLDVWEPGADAPDGRHGHLSAYVRRLLARPEFADAYRQSSPARSSLRNGTVRSGGSAVAHRRSITAM
ncbi:glutathione S-transferase C-terminal domain-containing protein [Streptantibioticus parmotrematis]|uniref:glutathione S-transferase C-terminal domain-containing protein n=1 Tax=Streptantibioticus parmotrematis TaxID=2873249 RepID=UPI0033F7AD1E